MTTPPTRFRDFDARPRSVSSSAAAADPLQSALVCLEAARRVARRYVLQHQIGGVVASVERRATQKKGRRSVLARVFDRIRRRVAGLVDLLLLVVPPLEPPVLHVEDGTEPVLEPLELLLTRARQLDLPPPSRFVVPREEKAA